MSEWVRESMTNVEWLNKHKMVFLANDHRNHSYDYSMHFRKGQFWD